MIGALRSGRRERRPDVGVDPRGVDASRRAQARVAVERRRRRRRPSSASARRPARALGERQLDRPGLPLHVGVLPGDRLGDAAPSTASPSSPSERRHRRPHLPREERIGPGRVLRVDVQPLAELEPALRGPVAAGPRAWATGASGFTWSGVSGETPPQSLIPASSSRGRWSGRRGSAGPGRCIRGPSTTRAVATVARNSSSSGSGGACIARAGLGPEVLDDDLLDVPVPAVQRRGSRTATRRARARSRRSRRGSRW